MQAKSGKSPGETTAGASRELVNFTPGREEYGIKMLKGQDIRGYDAVTTILKETELTRV